jgi:Uma2 family endonuclease
MPIYADWLVSHLWLIDPEQRTLEVYALEGNRGWLLLTTLQEDAEVRQPPFDALSFGLSGLWG